ncbi:MAG: energy-coupling factor transporter transmembrane component T family protein [Bacillota bacterium]
MLKNIAIGQYYNTVSPIHALDPRIKVILTAAFITMVFFVRNYWGYGVLFLFTCFLCTLSNVPPRILLRTLRPMLYILVFTFILNLLFMQGETVIFSWWIIRITAEGLNQAVFLALRLLFLVAGASFLTLTTSPIELTDALERLMKPLTVFRFPAHELAMMMSIALRFIPTLLDEADKIMKAQASRGADFESGSLMQRAKNMLPLLVPLFISAFRRADELALAMESRCYRGGTGRTRMKILKLGMRDAMATAFIAVLFTGIILWG